MINVAMGLTTLAIICKCDTVFNRQHNIECLRRACVYALLTDITVDVELDVRVVRPYDGVCAVNEVC